MTLLSVIAVLIIGALELAVLGFACLGVTHFIDNVNEYEKESESWIDEK